MSISEVYAEYMALIYQFYRRLTTLRRTPPAGRASVLWWTLTNRTACAAKLREEMATRFRKVDLLCASFAMKILTISTLRDISLTLRDVFAASMRGTCSRLVSIRSRPLLKFSPPRRVPHGVTLIGRLFDEGTLVRVGIALERAFNVVGERPPGF